MKEHRTPKQIQHQYEVEKELGNRLRRANQQERVHLYTAVYDEFYQRVPHQSQVTRKSDNRAQAAAASTQVKLLRPFLNADKTFLEVGAGDCAVSLEVAKFAKHVYAVEASTVISAADETPANFELIITDGSSIDVPPNSVDVAYSNQVMEHLHPEDAEIQLQAIYNALKPNGIYICITPNGLFGPHDISKTFDDIARGLHLKEYTPDGIMTLFKSTGFTHFSTFFGAKGHYLRMPYLFAKPIEWVSKLLPHKWRKKLAAWRVTWTVLYLLPSGINNRLIAKK